MNHTPSPSVQFFSNPAGGDEDKKLIGKKRVATAGSGNVSFAFSPAQKVAVGSVTATATDSAGNISEFSAPRRVVAS
jgi:hypothetical protein